MPPKKNSAANRYVFSGIFRSPTDTPLWGIVFVYSTGGKIKYFEYDGTPFSGSYSAVTEGYPGSDVYFKNKFVCTALFDDGSGDTIYGSLSIDGGIIRINYFDILGDKYTGPVNLKTIATGDIVGPGAATNEDIVVFNGTTGKVVKDSGVNISDILVSSDIGVFVQAYNAATTILGNSVTGTGNIVLASAIANMLTTSNIGSTVQAYNANTTTLGNSVSGTGAIVLASAIANMLVSSDIGTTVQGFDATLAALSGLATGANKFPYSTGTDTFSQLDLSLALQEAWITGLQNTGSVIKGYTLGMSPTMTYTTGSLTSGRIYWNAVIVPFDITSLSGIKFGQSTQGNYTANNTNSLAIYSHSAGTLTKIAESTNDGNLWKNASSSLGSKLFSTSPALTKGIYWAAFTYNSSAQTTAPSLTSLTTVQWMCNGDLTNSAKLFGTTSGTSLPATQAMSGITAASTAFPLIIF